MGIFQGDVIIKAMVDLGLDEMRKNEWLLDHALESLKIMPYISDKYGQANIDACKEWFRNNKVNIYMRPRQDKDEFPCVTIYPGAANEKKDMKKMADLTPEKVTIKPNTIGKPINYVVKPFTPQGYSPATGEVFVANGLPGLDVVVKGMILVDPATGTGYPILNVTADSIVIAEDTEIEATQFAVVPQFPIYEARVEGTFHQETYTIGCHAHGDPQTLIWLHTIVLYTIYRYREVLLEGNGFAESEISNSEFMDDPNFEGPANENAFLRYITITGQTENTWIKAPKRFIESVVIAENNNGNKTGGIKILSNLDDSDPNAPQNNTWYTVKDVDDDSDEDNDQS